MNRTKESGFTVIEILLVLLLVAIVGILGVLYYNSFIKKDIRDMTQVTNSPSTKKIPDQAKNPVSQTDEKVAIIDALKKHNSDVTLSLTEVDEIVDDNAKGRAGSADAGGFAFIAHKTGGNWEIVDQNQQTPGKEIGVKYGLPTSWYSQDY